VYLLDFTLPVADSVSSVTFDRGLYILTSALVSVTGIVAAIFLLSLSAPGDCTRRCLPAL
jgi:hypothetical protein